MNMPDHDGADLVRTSRMKWRAAVSALVLLCSACSSSVTGHGTVARQPSVPPPLSVSLPVATPTPTPTPTPVTVTMTGNAATNKACAFATVQEIEQISGRTVVAIDGFPANPATGVISCVWRLDPTVEYGGPVVSLQWDKHIENVAGNRQLMRDLIASKQRRPVRNLGDIAMQDGASLDIIHGDDSFLFFYRIRVIASEPDKEILISLARLMYSRADPP